MNTVEIHQPLLKIRNLKKTFGSGSIKALYDINLDIYSGEVLALVGDNGAGKSTLIKILSGVYPPDGGRIEFNGSSFSCLTPLKALELGISTVYQDLALVDTRDAACNIFLGREPLLARFFINKRKMLQDSARLLQQLKISIPSLRTPVGLLSGGQRQGIAVARSVNRRGKLLIFDEPTAAMGVQESSHVLELIKTLREQGFAVIVISHNLHHVLTVSQRICVLRQGGIAREFETAATNTREIVSCITGSAEQNGGIAS